MTGFFIYKSFNFRFKISFSNVQNTLIFMKV